MNVSLEKRHFWFWTSWEDMNFSMPEPIFRFHVLSSLCLCKSTHDPRVSMMMTYLLKQDATRKLIVYEIGTELSLKVLDNEGVEQDVSEKSSASDVIKAVESHSDLVPSVYEGSVYTFFILVVSIIYNMWDPNYRYYNIFSNNISIFFIPSRALKNTYLV